MCCWLLLMLIIVSLCADSFFSHFSNKMRNLQQTSITTWKYLHAHTLTEILRLVQYLFMRFKRNHTLKKMKQVNAIVIKNVDGVALPPLLLRRLSLFFFHVLLPLLPISICIFSKWNGNNSRKRFYTHIHHLRLCVYTSLESRSTLNGRIFRFCIFIFATIVIKSNITHELKINAMDFHFHF